MITKHQHEINTTKTQCKWGNTYTAPLKITENTNIFHSRRIIMLLKFRKIIPSFSICCLLCVCLAAVTKIAQSAGCVSLPSTFRFFWNGFFNVFLSCQLWHFLNEPESTIQREAIYLFFFCCALANPKSKGKKYKKPFENTSNKVQPNVASTIIYELVFLSSNEFALRLHVYLLLRIILWFLNANVRASILYQFNKTNHSKFPI